MAGSVIQGHPMSLDFLPIESAYGLIVRHSNVMLFYLYRLWLLVFSNKWRWWQ